jgi:WD40 repeat protein/serine/threonine protein kinase
MRSELPEELRADYELVRLLGMGASGSVHLATERATGRSVAIKVMRLAGSRSAAKRFEREADSLERLSHTSLVAHLGHGLSGDDAYLITEYVTGNSLKESTTGVDPEACMLQIAEALDAVHAAGLIHRDVKPANIMVTPEGRAVLLDLGLVVDPQRTRVTREGSLPGTMSFLPQEVLHGKGFTPAADWYAWGVTYYYLLEGKNPYGSTDVFAAAEGEPLPPLQFEKVDPRSGVGWLLRAACHPVPATRPASADACRRILEGARPVLDAPAASGHPVERSTVRARVERDPRGSHRPFWIGGTLLVAALSLAALTIAPAEPARPPDPPAPTTPASAPAPTPAPSRAVGLPAEVPPEVRPPWLEITSKPVAAGIQKMIIADLLGFRLCPIAFLPGERLLFNDFGGGVGILDLDRGDVVARFREGEGGVQSVALSPDARWAILGGDDRKAWKVGIPRLDVQLEVDGGTHELFAVAIAHDGETFAAAGDGPEVRVWNSESGDLVHTLTGHASRVISLAYQPDDRRIYAGGLAGVIRVWDLETGRAVARLPSEGRTVASMDFDIPGTRLVAGYLDGKSRVFDLATGELQATLEGHQQHVSSVRFSPLDRDLFTASWDGDVRIWDGKTYEARGVLRSGESRVMGLAITSYSVDLATLDDRGVVRMWSPQTRQLVATHELRQGEVHRYASSDAIRLEGDRLAGIAAGEGGVLVAADMAGVLHRLGEAGNARIETGLAGTHSVVVAGDHVVLAGEASTARVLALSRGATEEPLPGPGGALTALAFHPGQGRLALADAAGSIAWRPALREPPRTLTGAPAQPVRALCFTTDGTGLLAGFEDGQVMLWRRLEDAAPTRLGQHKAPVRAAAFAPGEGFVVTAADDGRLYYWDTDEGLLLQTQAAHEDRVTDLTFLADGRLASSGWDGTVRIWDLAGDGDVVVLKGHEGPVEGLALRGDSELVSAGWDGWLRIWQP